MGSLCLFLAALLWGTTFVAQSAGMERLGPFTYMAARYFLGMASLALLWLFTRDRRKQAPGFHAGWLVGVVLFAASATQQFGMQYTTVGKAAFITCLYLIFVPLTGLFMGARLRLANWVATALAVVGLALLCLKDDLSLGYGDAIILLSSLCWTAHILATARFAADVDIIEMSLGQVMSTWLLSTVAALTLEPWVWGDVADAWFSIFYAGVMSTGVAFTLQIVGQRYAEASVAAILMSLESVFGALAGWVVLGQTLAPRELLGCALMLAGVLLTQLAALPRRQQA